MINKQIKLVLVIGFVGLTILQSFPISTIIIAMLLGVLFGPSILLFASVFIEGIHIFVKELQAPFEYMKRILCNFRIRRIYNLRAAV